MFLEDSMDVFYATKGLKSIVFTIINWFQALSSIKKRPQNLLEILKFVEKSIYISYLVNNVLLITN